MLAREKMAFYSIKLFNLTESYGAPSVTFHPMIVILLGKIISRFHIFFWTHWQIFDDYSMDYMGVKENSNRLKRALARLRKLKKKPLQPIHTWSYIISLWYCSPAWTKITYIRFSSNFLHDPGKYWKILALSFEVFYGVP